MTPAVKDTFTSESFVLSWVEGDGGPTASIICRVEAGCIRHVVEKHVHSQEPWGRILDASLVTRMAEAAADGGMPCAADCRSFVRAIAGQLEACCSQPLLCRFREDEIPVYGESGRPGGRVGLFRTSEKILLLLARGAVAFLRMDTPVSSPGSAVLLTIFFPRQANGWVRPEYATAAAVSRYVQRWADLRHPTGGRLLPEPADTVFEDNAASGTATRRRCFRFITPENWGFCRQNDGQNAWNGPV